MKQVREVILAQSRQQLAEWQAQSDALDAQEADLKARIAAGEALKTGIPDFVPELIPQDGAQWSG